MSDAHGHAPRFRTQPRGGRRAALLALVPACALAAGCELFKPGRDPLAAAGPRAMEPYVGRASGALRLGLQLYNGCGVLGNGNVTGPGNTRFSWPYPTNCTNLHGVTRPASANPPLPIVVGVPYFLDQLTIADVASNLHTNPADQRAPLTWFRTATRFKNLDWSGAALVNDQWEGDRAVLGGFSRELRYGGAAWMHSEDDSFLLEILDADGNVLASTDSPRESFALENPVGGHTQFTYLYGVVGKPEFLGDARISTVPTQPVGGASVRPPSFRTLARLDVVAQARPFDRTFTLPEDLRGDGVARVTWSLLPDEPFYFPLTFTHPDEAAFPQCWSADDPTQRVACDFGLEPEATFTAPRNGEYFEPGETLQMLVKFKDGAGNLLHPPDALPSYNDFLAGKSNGLLYQYGSHNGTFGERAVWSSMSVQGPIQQMKPFYGTESEHAWFSQWGRGQLPNAAAVNNLRTGARDVPGETRWPIELPHDAEPGTYVALVKANRQFMGERTVRTNVFYFQVGQSKATRFPQRVGNCDICHMGPTSLSNIAMGQDTGAVEACKACHGSSLGRVVHQVHMSSDHFPARKNDCTVCHLQHESVLRASLLICNSCHMQSHGAQYFDQSFTALTTSSEPNLQSSCADVCHGKIPPTQHIIPPKRVTQ